MMGETLDDSLHRSGGHEVRSAITRRDFFGLAGAAAGSLLLSGCGCAKEEPAPQQLANALRKIRDTPSMDYMVLVNKTHRLPENWEQEMQTVSFTNAAGWEVEIEKKAYQAFLELKEDLASEGVYVDLDNAYRSVATQERIEADNLAEKGQDFVDAYVAVPGYSEHHTGLAMDLFLIIDGGVVYFDEELFENNDLWERIHAKLGKHGFILRYPEGKEDVTGYSYEAWHIRFLNSPSRATFIMEQGLTLEEYLEGARK